MVLNETPRFYPIVTRLERVCKKDVELNDAFILKWSLEIVSCYSLCHDPQNWPEHKEFCPERYRDIGNGFPP